MFCKFCGKEIETDIKFCPYCGKDIVENQNSGFAITGLILGILSSIFYGLAIFQILAIIFCIIALVKIKNKKASGKKMAIAGLILGILYTVQFAIKLPAQIDYYKNLYNQSSLSYENQENNTMQGTIEAEIEENPFIGTWKCVTDIGNNGSIVIENVYTIKEYTYVRSCVEYHNNVMDMWYTDSGTMEFKGNNKAILVKTSVNPILNANYKEILNINYSPIEIEYKDGYVFIGSLKLEKINE